LEKKIIDSGEEEYGGGNSTGGMIITDYKRKL
jgi:hypothetical protein